MNAARLRHIYYQPIQDLELMRDTYASFLLSYYEIAENYRSAHRSNAHSIAMLERMPEAQSRD